MDSNGDIQKTNAVKKHGDSTPFLDKIQEDEFFSDRNMVEFVKSFMTHLRRGSQTHLNSIIPLLQLTNKLPQHMNVGNSKTKRQVEEVEYNVAPPA